MKKVSWVLDWESPGVNMTMEEEQRCMDGWEIRQVKEDPKWGCIMGMDE